MDFSGFSIQFLQAAGTFLFSIKGTTLFLFMVFAILAVGYLLGKISIKGVSLGSAGVFLAALIAGHFKGVLIGYTTGGQTITGTIAGWSEKMASIDGYVSILQNIGLVLFVTSVGLIAGPTFFKNLKKNAKSYVLLGAVIIVSGALVTFAIAKLVPNMTGAMAAGLMSGALTSTPAFSAAKEAAGEDLATTVAVGQAVAYPFGVIGVVLFVQLVPKFMKANMEVERNLIKVADDKTKEKAETKKEVKTFSPDKFGLTAFCITIISGLILGSIHIPMGSGASFALGATGGPLIMGLIYGHFGRIGKLSMKVQESLLLIFQEFGLVLFLTGAGIEGGAAFVKTLSEFGPMLFVYGALITIVPLFIGFFFAKYVLKLSLLNNLGSITGGMTSTPALGTLIKTAGTSEVASAYAATYPLALVLVVLAAQFIGRMG